MNIKPIEKYLLANLVPYYISASYHILLQEIIKLSQNKCFVKCILFTLSPDDKFCEHIFADGWSVIGPHNKGDGIYFSYKAPTFTFKELEITPEKFNENIIKHNQT